MSHVGTYLNFPGNTEEAFNFYKSVFGGDFVGGKMDRFVDIPQSAVAPPIPEEDRNLIMHVALPILGDHYLMGTDAPESLGFKVTFGNNVYISLHPDTRIETKRLFDALCEGGQVETQLNDTFWGAYYGSCTDRFGVHWMLNCEEKQ